MIPRKKTMPPDLAPAWEAFQAQAVRVEQARQALLRCLPVGRVAPAPIGLGLDLLRDELGAVRADMDAWRVPAAEEDWRACREAVDEAVAHIEPAREVSLSTSELEHLLNAVTDVVEPLDVWARAERNWRKRRVRA